MSSVGNLVRIRQDWERGDRRCKEAGSRALGSSNKALKTVTTGLKTQALVSRRKVAIGMKWRGPLAGYQISICGEWSGD